MKVISIRKEHLLAVLYAAVILVGIIKTYNDNVVTTFSMPVSKKIVIIDPGHGGEDPGKVAGKVKEKDINLKIAKKLQAYLEQGGSVVLLTRDDDDDTSKNKKNDMYKRKLTANSSKADIFVSIHQNSYTESSVKGAQVFYFDESGGSKKLASSIQSEIKSFVDYRNKFTEKANPNYYVLRQTTMPAVIVECGFLSNPSERQKLQDDDYQERIAWAIYMGIVKYFDTSGTAQ